MSRARRYPNEWQRKAIWSAVSALAVCFLILVVIAVIWLMANVVSFLQPILIPVAIAAILAYLLDPLVTRMHRNGLSRTKAVLLIFAIAAVALTALGAWLVPAIWVQGTNLAKELPQYSIKARDQVVDFIYRYDRTFGGGSKNKGGAASGVINWLLGSTTAQKTRAQATGGPSPTPAPQEFSATASPPPVTVAERERIQQYLEKQIPLIQNQLPNLTERVWTILKKSIGGFLGITGFLLSLIMVPIYLFFLLKERPAIERRWKEYLPLRNSPLKDEVATVLTQINSYVIAYFRGQLLVCLVDGILIGAALSFVSLNFAPLIGALVVVLTMIPYIGIILCWIPAVIIAAAQWGDVLHPVIVTLIFIIVQNLEGLFYAPRIVGNSVGLHPMTVIVSIFVWGLLIGGLLGPILAVPLTATVKVLLARYVWGKRLREQVIEEVEEVPVVEEAEIEAARARAPA